MSLLDVLDNDIVAKVVIYNLTATLMAALKSKPHEIGVLRTLVFSISPKRLRSAPDGPEVAYQRLRDFTDILTILEPTTAETNLAIRLEETAQENGVDLDVGESQLVAIALCRKAGRVCTGDKRAVTAVEKLSDTTFDLQHLHGRLVIFELLTRWMIEVSSYNEVRSKVCGAVGADGALDVCFQCHNQTSTEEATRDGLSSYLAAVKRAAPRMCAGN